jgi:hypothetical protein
MADPCPTRALMRSHDHRAIAARCVRAEAENASLIDAVTRLTSEKVTAEDRERARIVDLIQSYPLGADGPADGIERERLVLKNIIAQIKREAA